MIRQSAAFAAGLGIAVTALGCNQADKGPSVTRERSQAVSGEVAANAPTVAPPPSKPTASAPSKPRGPLCAGQMSEPGRAMPRGELSRTSAPGQAEPPARLAAGRGKWTWINFWAAWCVPCKEEIPRLKGWQKKLASDGKKLEVVFVSLDDDERQLGTFLKTQPADGLISTYWLREGDERMKWLKEAGFESEPELPAHLLVDPQGKLRCTIVGAVEDGDYPSLVALL